MNNDKNPAHPFESFSDFVFGPDTRKIIVLKENGKEYRALNNDEKKCVALQIDGGIINDDTPKCDKGLIVLNNKKFYLVELKGVDLSTACKQLHATFDRFSKELKAWKYDYYCRVVLSGVSAPNNYPTSYKMLLKRLNNDKRKVVCKTKVLEERI